MRRVILASLLALSAAGSALPVRAADPAPAVEAEVFDPALLEKAHVLVDLVLPPAERDKMFEGIMNATMSNMLAGMMDGQTQLRDLMNQNEEIRTEFVAFIDRQRQMALDDLRATTPDLVDAYAHFYARNFTAAEMDEVIAFVRTPAGAKYMRQSSTIMADPDVAAWQRRITARQQARTEQEIRALSEKITTILQNNGAQNGS